MRRLGEPDHRRISAAAANMPSACDTCGNNRSGQIFHRCLLCYRHICRECRRNDLQQCVMCPQDRWARPGLPVPNTSKAERVMMLLKSGELDRMADDATRRAGAAIPPGGMEWRVQFGAAGGMHTHIYVHGMAGH